MRSPLLLPLAVLLISCDGPSTDDPTNTDTEATSDTEDTEDTEPAGDTTCAELGLEAIPWQDGGEDYVRNGLAGDLTIPTTDGDVTLSELWTGCESFLFIPSSPSTAPEGTYNMDVWDRQRDANELLENAPLNVHLFFVPSTRSTLDEDVEEITQLMKKSRKKFDDETNDWWKTHLHFVDERSGAMPGWLGEHFNDENFGVGVDRFQRIRFIGSYADPENYDSSIGWFGPNIAQAAFEAVYYNFEAERDAELEAQGATVVEVWDDEVMSHGWSGPASEVTVDLPEASEMASYDSMWFDLTLECNGDGEYGTCPAWDYLVYLYLCDEDAAGDNPWADTTCQPYEAEVAGTCYANGTATALTCTSTDDCESAAADTGDTADYSDVEQWSCEGYTEAVEADTQEGTCSNWDGEDYDSTYTCGDDGTGYDDLACSCPEFGRWITTYHRAGRWAHDVSSLLPMVASGGERTFKYYTTQEYVVDLDVRLFDAGKEAKPAETVNLWYENARFSSYNDSREAVEVDIPSDATKVELAVVASGHGQNAPGNCAEFCVTEHWFYVGDELNVFSLEDAGTDDRCQEQVAEGTIPNQYGTWWYGRSNWCPGKEVDVHTIDITDQVVAGETATLEYYGYLEDGEPMDTSSGNVIVNTWLVISKDP